MQRKRQIFGTLRPLKSTFLSECDFTLKVRVLIFCYIRFYVIDRLIYVVLCSRGLIELI